MYHMASINATTSHRYGQMDGSGKSQDAPPSTLAANFASNLSNSRRASKRDDEEDFQRLLLELAKEEKDTDGASTEAILHHYHKLIYVVVRAVLEGLAGDKPHFNEPELLLQRAIEGLHIVNATIKETPEVLDHVADPNVQFHSGSNVPLWLWLFPRILSLVGRQRCESMQEKITEFFQICFNEAYRSLQLWTMTTLFYRYLQHCAGATLEFLRNSKISSHRVSRVLSLKLPLVAVEDDVPIYGTPDLHSAGCSYSLDDSESAIRHCCYLLALVMNLITSSTRSAHVTSAIEGHLIWILDSFIALREIENTLGQSSMLPRTRFDLCAVSLNAVYSLLKAPGISLPETVERKGCGVLAHLVADIIDFPDFLSQLTVQVAVCYILLELAGASRRHELVLQTTTVKILPAVQKLLDMEASSSMLNPDLLQCIAIIRQKCQRPGIPGESHVSSTISFEIPALLTNFNHLALGNDPEDELNSSRPSKRRKLSKPQNVLVMVVQEAYTLLGSQKATDLDGLSQVAPGCFAQLKMADRCQAVKQLGYIPCANSGTLTLIYSENGALGDSKCSVCDSVVQVKVDPSAIEYDEKIAVEAIATLRALIDLPEFGGSRKPRILGMLALRRYANHFHHSEFFDLETSTLGQWCLKSFRSSMRELRIAAGRTLPAFLREGIEPKLLRKNKVNALDYLRTLSEQNTAHLTETCILAWGQIGRISKDEELNLVLLRLVEYLGHTNQIASSAAFNEIVKISEVSDIPMAQMFRPFWRSIGPTAVKELQTRPQTAQLLAELLRISVTDLLISIQTYILPWLILTGKKDVILRIMQARGDEGPETVCIAESNIGPIMALLLVQNVPDLENVVMALFRNISSYFDEWHFVELLKIEPLLIAVELLKNAAEEEHNKRSKIRQALQFLASHTYNGSMEKQSSRKGNQVGPFLEHFVLPIMFHFSDLLNDTQNWQCIAEKRRSLKGIEEMLRVGKGHIRSALPQICACLQSAMANNDIRSLAFSAWKTMIRSLDARDIGPMLETTFSTIILNWNSFDMTSREQSRELIQFLLEQRKDVVREFIENIPSLGQIQELADYDQHLSEMRTDLGVRLQYRILARRIKHEHESVVTLAMIELKRYLRQHQGFLQASAVSEQPDSVVGEIIRTILDACVKFGEDNLEIAQLSAECIGLIGCLDSNRVESVRGRKEIVVVSNFEDREETANFVLFILEEVFVKAFLSATNPRTQAFLSYAMQELLKTSDITETCLRNRKAGESSAEPLYIKWLCLPEIVRQTLTPFLKSKYVLGEMTKAETSYPIFENKANRKYGAWLRSFVLDLLRQPHNGYSLLIFAPLCRVIKIEDLSVANFLLPFIALHGVVLGSDEQRKNILSELLSVLSHDSSAESHSERTNLKLCSEAVFRTLDYMSQWIQERQIKIVLERGYDSRWSHSDDDPSPPDPGIQRVSDLLSAIPAEVISRRAVECESYSRALFHWEQNIRQRRGNGSNKIDMNPLLQRLQDIYNQIDEPDGIEGIAAHLHVLDIDQQILGHRKAGRWTAAQTWYEIQLAEDPHDVDVQINLLHCLKESGQHDVLLNYVEGMHKTSSAVAKLLPFATEASWTTGRWDTLQKYLSLAPHDVEGDFNIGIGHILLALHKRDATEYTTMTRTLRQQIACSLSPATTSSLSVCRDAMLKFHVLTELDMIAGPDHDGRKQVLESLDRRLEAIGAYLNDKQYLLGIRRAAMQLTSPSFSKLDVASAWLTSARLARKGNSLHQSFNAVLHASQLGDESATIEHARLLWKEGHHRKAIQSLQGAINTNAFISHNRGPVEDVTSISTEDLTEQQNLLTARAHLLLAKWLDSAGHTHSTALRSQYQLAAKMHLTWEKGHYYLGRHYNKILESEKSLPPEQQAQSYLIGDIAKLVIENYLRSLSYGTKYVYQTLPRVITLWLDLGTQVDQPMEAKYGTKDFILRITALRKERLAMLHSRFSKYISKMPAYIFYTALPQIVARIAHPNSEVYQFLQAIIVKVVSSYPQQALWTLLAVSTSNQPERKTRGLVILATLRNIHNAKKMDTGSQDVKNMIKNGERLASQLLMVCNAGEFQGNRTITASITKDLGFNHRICTPSPLCVPIESALTATLPTLTDNIRSHKAFSRDVVTVSQFHEDVLVLGSLQKPRKLTARGSDGQNYGLLCKPKDDLRKDQRLMEFNSMINRSLKRDAESSKRQLYIKTYAVTPLNEECGIIEWVDGLKTLRDILVNLYKVQGIVVKHNEIKVYLDEACKGDDKLPFFTAKVLRMFPPVFHSWFVQQFPEPSAWFLARLKYTRSCAVMSMVGTILGLGDRHGENILFEEGNGGTFHVDFNCLFDKGLTFAQPERVPFRLTHNMTDAMGVYGFEGPFRKSSELTLKLLRQHEETLMTILEAFVYDPTLDLLAKKGDKRRREREDVGLVPDTAQGVLDSIKRKVRGLLVGESVPLGVEGQVDELIKQAVNPKNLAAMYIGWCSFF